MSDPQSSKHKMDLFQYRIINWNLDENAPSVFISYSQSQDTTGDHRNWVARFARKLSGLGIKVEIDLNLDGTQTFSSFMYNSIKQSQYVICICSSSYVDRTRDSSKRTGVLREYEMILDRSNNQALKDFVIPVLKDSSSIDYPQKVPDQFSSIDCKDFDNKQKALRAFPDIVEILLNFPKKLKNFIYEQYNKKQKVDPQRISDIFRDKVYQYWIAELSSKEEEELKTYIISDEVFNLPDKFNTVVHKDDSFETRHGEKAIFGIGKWDMSYEGDKEILSLLTGERNNE